MMITQAEIAAGLTTLGIKPGDHLLVHSSLSSFGQVEGGADAVINALLTVVTGEGIVSVPTLTGSEALSPAHPPEFDPQRTPCWTGKIPTTFMRRPTAVRSLHPTHSVAAIGQDVGWYLDDHLDSISPCDDLSPYGKLAHDERGYVLLLGVSHQSSTIFHHIEEAAGVDYHLQPGLARCKIILPETTIYRHYLLHAYGTPRQFDMMEPLLIERGIQRSIQIGHATAKLIAAQRLTDLTLRCLKTQPRLLCQDNPGTADYH